MPTTIKSENFDGVTAPAIPAGFTADTGIVTATDQYVSSPNALKASNTASALNIQYNTADANSGDVQVTCKFRFDTTNALGQLWIRGTGTQVPQGGSTNRYEARITLANTSSLSLFKRVAGVSTLIATVGTNATFAAGIWYTVQLKASSTTISVTFVQRSTDSYYLNSSGTWVSSQPAAPISVTDSTIAGAGLAGVTIVPQVSGNAWADDFLFESLATVTPATTLTLTGPTSGVVSVASANFTVALNGTYTGTITPASTGSGTFSPTSLSGPGTFTYTPSSSVGSPHSVSISASPSLSYGGSPIGYTVNSGVVTIATSDANVFASPYNWR